MRLAALHLDRAAAEPLHRQLVRAIRDMILTGRLLAGDRVLSSRELQTALGVSRSTVLTAVSQLLSEGYLVSERGRGTFVAGGIHARRYPPEVPEQHLAPRPRRAELFAEASKLREPTTVLREGRRAVLPFRLGIPALDAFPMQQLKRCFNSASRLPDLMDYPRTWGSERLRHAIAQRLRQTRGVVCDPEQIIVCSGTHAAFHLIGLVLLKERDAVIVEDPGYLNFRATMLAHGARLLPAPVDDAGIVVGQFPRRSAALVYVTPSHQFPTGSVLSLERRFALLDWANRHNAWIVEDDYDSEFNYTGRLQPALAGLDDGRRVLYVGTFSKSLSPALHLAYVVVPRTLAKTFGAAQDVTGGQPSPVLQQAVAIFLEKGLFARHIIKMRRLYDERRRFLAERFSAEVGARVRDFGNGMHFVVELERTKDTQFSTEAAKRGVIVPPLSSYYAGTPALNGVVIGFAGTPIPVAQKAMRQLRGLL